ncbi:MAG: 4Fe-4S dicluster domain-containing protein [Anaerolineae bacterium]|jgi:ferredoxin
MKLTTLKDLQAWLDRLTEEQDLIAPCDVQGHILYRPVASSSAVAFDYERPALSAKEYLLPETEVILRLQQRGKELVLDEHLPERRQVLFGIRPCDAHGLAVIDALFLEEEPIDRVYQHHRERTTLVGLACPEMWEGCFCTSVGGAPRDATHLDVLLWRADGGYAVQAVTEKGASLLVELKAEERPGESPPPVTDAEAVPVTPPEAWPALFKDQMWRRHGERCLSCRICTYVCPTCRCFDVADRVVEMQASRTRIERIRVWDACTSTNYRRVAGGHNPRATKPDRLRNRFFCKFCYYPEDFGATGCVGCGRCIVSCPVDIDITEVLNDVAERSHA